MSTSSIMLRLIHLLEQRMRQANLWHCSTPSHDAMQSTEPFAVDTMHLEQWLKFIFIPRMRALIDGQHPLPERCVITPHAEQMWARPQSDAVIEVLMAIDAFISENRMPSAKLLKTLEH
ncbi:hypothetical protein BFW38_12255 [Terasakiispira papahanaumokuakeensis]|uniref:YqcC-like domain-containing protein n=1 Tax=Terasakiispira papahanaumokuakeensis TaxID=197479 RepID=A0A1E2VBZ0_9GAMM|nr:YqcC family protein [Terasakiispira papahanaumokuakeensis]ODC04185.1 hypothetical protein BFW38_12255 [Terasakiispira papahanaumokuakeensis]